MRPVLRCAAALLLLLLLLLQCAVAHSSERAERTQHALARRSSVSVALRLRASLTAEWHAVVDVDDVDDRASASLALPLVFMSVPSRSDASLVGLRRADAVLRGVPPLRAWRAVARERQRELCVLVHVRRGWHAEWMNDARVSVVGGGADDGVRVERMRVLRDAHDWEFVRHNWAAHAPCIEASALQFIAGSGDGVDDGDGERAFAHHQQQQQQQQQVMCDVEQAGTGASGSLFVDDAALSYSSASVPAWLPPFNPYLGRGGSGFGTGGLPMCAQEPFGMIRVGPDTSLDDGVVIPWRHTGGYHFCDTHIRAFSHLHMVGSGVLDLGLLGVMPVSEPVTSPLVEAGMYRSLFRHETELMYPGYYAVHLDRYDVDAELTVLHNTVAVHRYTFAANATTRSIIFDLGHTLTPFAQAMNTSAIFDVANSMLVGEVHNIGQYSNRFGGAHIYFAVSIPFAIGDYGVFNNFGIEPRVNQVYDKYAGAYVTLHPRAPQTVELVVAVSFISIEYAMANLRDALAVCPLAPNVPVFDCALARTSSKWQAVFAKVNTTGGSLDEQKVFYAALYNTHMAPTNFTETSGWYSDIAQQPHPSNGFDYYTDFSMWDTFRTEHPLLNLLQPEHSADMMRSLVQMAKDGGHLPRWPFLNGYTGGMFGTYVVPILVGAFENGVDFDLKGAYPYLYAQATTDTSCGRSHTDLYNTLGYVPQDVDGGGTVCTLAYSYADGMLATAALKLGFTNDSKLFATRSRNYANVFDPKLQFFCPRHMNGTYYCPSNLQDEFKEFTEGDAYNYRFNAEHDGPGLVQLFGGAGNFVQQLNDLFERGAGIPHNALPNPFYWAGNEEDLYFPVLFHHAHAAHLSSQWVRWILANRYKNTDYGIPGNDDYGCMSAWYMWGAMGLFPLSGTSTYFVLSPVFDSVTLTIGTSTLRIRALAADGRALSEARAVGENPTYIVKAQLNGKSLDPTAPFASFGDLLNGELDIWLSNTPPTDA